MGFVLVVVGLLMVVTGGRGTYAAFGRQVASDFTGPNNFTYWIVGLGAVGAVGYIDSLRTFSRLFMTLIILAMLLSNRGFFARLSQALKSGPVAPEAPPAGTANTSTAPSTWKSTGEAGGANPMNQGLFGQSPDGYLGDQSRANNFFNSVVKFFSGGYASP